MRRTALLTSALRPVFLHVLLVTAGCSSPVPRSDGPGGPITAPATTAPVVASNPPSSTAAAVPSSSPTPSVSPSRRPSAPATPTVLGHYGFEALKLGMTSKQARATGLIAPWVGKEGAGCGLRSYLKGAHGEGAGNDGTVLLSGDTGVEVIDAYPGISTPEASTSEAPGRRCSRPTRTGRTRRKRTCTPTGAGARRCPATRNRSIGFRRPKAGSSS